MPDSTPPTELVSALRTLLNRAQQPAQADDQVARNVDLTWSFDGGGLPIAIGAHAYLVVDFPCRISGWFAVADVSGSCSWDLNGGSFGAFPTMEPLVASGGITPAISGAPSGSGDVADLGGWTLTISKGTVLEAVVTNCVAIGVATLSLRAKRLDI